MDKLFSKIASAFFLASALCLCSPGIRAHAAENVQDGVKLSITTDRSDYELGDNIIAKISLENNSGNDITDISIESTVPEGYHLEEGKSSVLRSTYIMSGNSISSELVFIPDKAENEPTEKETVTTAAADKDDVHETTVTAAVSQTSITSVTSTSVSDSESNKKGSNMPPHPCHYRRYRYSGSSCRSDNLQKERRKNRYNDPALCNISRYVVSVAGKGR